VKQQSLSNHSLALIAGLLAILLSATAALGQGTSFAYQGRLTDGGTAANGNYDLQFALWDSASGGAQIGSSLTLNTVAVSNGLFSVSLDFGAGSFTGASRFLEISARPVSVGTFTLLSPRQQVTATPYAIRSANASLADNATNAGTATNATQLGGVAAGQYVQTGDSRLSDARSPTAGSVNYIQNTTSQQASTNFSISGSGTANILNATTQFNLNGNRILSNPLGNLFAGVGAGQNNNAILNTFVGTNAGQNNNAGNRNSFFGQAAGLNNDTGSQNSFFGESAGTANTLGGLNSFFGVDAGFVNTFGDSNAFFGQGAGIHNNTGSQNSFFGEGAGASITFGVSNTFIGNSAGATSNTNVSGFRNTLLGAGSDVQGSNLSNATAIGAAAVVTQGNSLVLGSFSGNGACATCDTSVGIGISAPAFRLHVVDPGAAGLRVQTNTSGGAVASFGGFGDFQIDANGVTGGRFLVQQGGNVGIGTNAPDSKLTVNGTADKPGGGSWGTFSDERLKNLNGRFTPGLNAVLRLQPLRYEYKPDNALGIKSEGEHIGFSAQAVQKVIPEAVSANDKGYLVVNNDPILWTMLNAIKEQQAQVVEQREEIARQREENLKERRLNEQQQAELARQRRQLSALRNLVCRSHSSAAVCK
jgi:hypothetical protein